MIKGMIRLSLVVVGAMIASAVWTALHLPAAARLPLHWNADGMIDRNGDKWLALLLPAGLSAFTTVLFAALPAVEPMRSNLDRSTGLYRVVWITMLAMFAVVHLMVLDAAYGWDIVGVRWLLAAIGLVFVLIGNQLGKSRPTYLLGIRTPWTLADQDVWIATHRFGGKLMVLAGIVWIAVAVVGLAGRPSVLIAFVGVIVGAPILYSYLLWRRLPRDPVAP